MTTFVETKRHLNKPTQIFECDLAKRGAGWVLIRYVSSQDWRVEGTLLPVGTTTWAYYETGAQCVVWRMIAPNDRLLGHLFHICSDIIIVEDGVTYLDLLLDIWVDPSGKTTLLDEDDLSDCVGAGVLSASRAETISLVARAVREDVGTWCNRIDVLMCPT